MISNVRFSDNYQSEFVGKHYRGKGDVEYIRLLDDARSMLEPNPILPNIAMFYKLKWNAFMLSDDWTAWWIQNTYGPSYCALPFLQEPYITFLQNSQDFWFDNMGNGVRQGFWGGPCAKHLYDLIAPDGCLCDCAGPGSAAYKQGDTNIIYKEDEIIPYGYTDWAMEFTAAGVVLQAELLLIQRDIDKIKRYLPKLERCLNFIETRRDPEKNLFIAGEGANLLAPAYSGSKKDDGSYGDAYLTGLSITYIAALDRLIELEKIVKSLETAQIYEVRRSLAKDGLKWMIEEEGYFIKYMEFDGTKHGVYGQKRYGYFEAPPNHDAICFHIADDYQANKIYDKIASIPELRPYDLIIPNYPSYDDLSESKDKNLEYGRWVNGGHWATCEARMIMAYYRLGKFDDARRSFKKYLELARKFQLDAPLTEFGNDIWFKEKPINIVYDAFGPSMAFIRGLYEYLYSSDKLEIIPHIPEGIYELEQLDPVKFGNKKLFIKTVGTGNITEVSVNESKWDSYDNSSVYLDYNKLPDKAHITINREQQQNTLSYRVDQKNNDLYISETNKERGKTKEHNQEEKIEGIKDSLIKGIDAEHVRKINLLSLYFEKYSELYSKIKKDDLMDEYSIGFIKLSIEYVSMVTKRMEQILTGEIEISGYTASYNAVNCKYIETAEALCKGVEKMLDAYRTASEAKKLSIYEIWKEIRIDDKQERVG